MYPDNNFPISFPIFFYVYNGEFLLQNIFHCFLFNAIKSLSPYLL